MHQDERITAVEVRQVTFEERLLHQSKEMAEQFEKHRDERREDLRDMNERNGRAHDAICNRLDTLINGKK